MKGGIYFIKGKIVVRFKGVWKTCQSVQEAEEVLTGLRFKDYEGTFDARDYAKANPLGFRAQAERWLNYRRGEVKCYRNLQSHIHRAVNFFGEKNVKEIGYAELEDFFKALPEKLSGKSRYNIKTTLHSFWTWLAKREKARGFTIPDFPEISFTLGWRATVSKETQSTILDEIRHISWGINPRIWFGIFLLANFPKLRPNELIQVKEQDIDRKTGEVWIRHTKEGKEKRIYLLPEDLDFINSLPQGLPSMPFFRHGKRKGISQAHRLKYAGQFGKDYLYSWWKQACRNLGIEGVDLYGGTKHSTVTAARDHMTPEEIRRYLTEHQTNAAFDRYLQVDSQKQREASRRIRSPQDRHKLFEEGGRGKVLKLRD